MHVNFVTTHAKYFVRDYTSRNILRPAGLCCPCMRSQS